MERSPVQSSNIASIGYDDATRTMEIEFNSGGIYQYFDVPRDVYDGLKGAASVGNYFHVYVRGYYRYAKT